MPLPVVAAGVGLGMNALKSGYGLYQMLTNKKPTRPTYETPGEIGGILDIAKRRDRSGMPGADIMEGNIGAATAGAFTESRKQGRFDVGGIFEKNLDAMRELGLTEANFKLNSEDSLKKALGLVAGYKDKEFEYNEAGRYQDEQADFYANRQSGLQNIFGGAQGMLDTGLNYQQGMQTQQIIDALYPQTV